MEDFDGLGSDLDGLGGCFNGVHAFLPKMQNSGEESRIIATCSTSGFIAYPMLGLYSASKFGIRGLMTSLRAELGMSKSNVGVSIVCPGEVATNIVNSTFQSQEPSKPEPAASIDPMAMLEVAAEDAQNTYPLKDHTEKEVDDFINSLTDVHFQKISKFFDTMPTLKHDIHLQCTKKKKNKICSYKETITLSGLQSFFA